MDLKTLRVSLLMASAAHLALSTAGASAADLFSPRITAPPGVGHFVMTDDARSNRPHEASGVDIPPFAMEAGRPPAAQTSPITPAEASQPPAPPVLQPSVAESVQNPTPQAAASATVAAPSMAVAPPSEPQVPSATKVATPEAQTLSEIQVAALRDAIEALREGNIAAADALRPTIGDPAAAALLDWLAMRNGVAMSFERISAFQAENPDWPVTTLIRRRAEEALLAARKPSALVRAYFAKESPVTGSGKLALAFALKADGEIGAALPLVRSAWREDAFGRDMESRILETFPDALATADHRYRMERFLFRESWVSALRAAAYAGDDYVLLAKARMAADGGGKKAEKALAAVPGHLRSDPSYRFSRALYLRRKEKIYDAAQAMADVTRDPALLVDGDGWWAERRMITRKLLDKGEAALAYQVASRHGAESDAQRIEAEFQAGWIALRFLHNAAAAREHFAEAARVAETPISIARAAYWQARAAEALGSADEAQRHYQRAAAFPIAYYGQLARDKLGYPPVELRRPEQLDEASRSAFQNLRPVKALKLLQSVQADDLAISLYGDLAQKLSDVAHLDALASLAAEQGNARALLAVGKAAVQRGFPLDAHAYPTFGIPSFETVGDPVEEAMVYAITRQESAFNAKALSTAGARGLMQLMPATAKRTAQRFGVGFDVKRLVEDPAYNARIGAAHLGELMEDWRGSHILAFASYNAGGGNVSKWIKAYGDPRMPGVDPVDWVERIPFSETRNYVQRVLENLKIYRRRLEDRKLAERLPAGGSPGGTGASAAATDTSLTP
jgi:soluble lytic murein transglycosylase